MNITPRGTPSIPVSEGSVSAFRSGDTSAIRALETIVEPGTVIGEYRIGKLMGRGGIAAVYDATHTETGAVAALKILDIRFSSSPEVVGRFMAEAETLSQFEHPNIVGYRGHGQDEDFVYLAMEHVQGINLDQLFHAITLEPRHFAHLAHEISKALTAIHARGLVHGDVKPSNILVTRPGAVKISDFGAAARAATQGSRNAQARVQGTSAYMAPELLNPAAGVDHRADIYALGVTFYKIATGRLPQQPLVPASQVNEALPQGLDSVLERALSAEPEGRFVTVKEFCDAIAHVFEQPELTTPVAISPAAEPVLGAGAGVAGVRTQAGISDETLPAREGEKGAKGGETEMLDWRLILLIAAVALVVGVGLIAAIVRQ